MTAPAVPVSGNVQQPHSGDEAPWWVSASTGLVIFIWIGAFGFGVLKGSWLLLGPTLSVPILYGLTRLFAGWFAANDGDPTVVPLVMGAWSVKILGTVGRYSIDKKIYGGSDAWSYDQWGRYLASNFRHFHFAVNLGGGPLSGTKFMNVLTGIVYSITPASLISGDLWFSWLGFLGLLTFWRAFKLAMPQADHRRYAMFVLLLPSLVFWPSSVGKEAWMVLCLGLASYAAAALVTRRPATAIVALTAGIAGIVACRPHLGFVVFTGLMCAIVLRRNKSGSPFGTWLAIGLLLVMGLVIVKENKKFFGVDSFDSTQVSTQLDDAQGRTSGGGSQFTAVQGTSLANFPLAFVTVLYRPFPGEVGSVGGIITSLESLAIVGITIASRKSLRRILTSFRQDPYISYCVGYLIVFVIAFSSFSNFGILARERTQVLPLYLALLALQPLSTKDTVKGPRRDARNTSSRK